MPVDSAVPGPKTLARVVFTKTLNPVEHEGDLDPANMGAILGTLLNLAVNNGRALKLGNINSIYSWGKGQGLQVLAGPGGYEMSLLQDVTSWNEILTFFSSDTKKGANGSNQPLFPSKHEISELLNEMKHVGWYGSRASAANTWNHSFKAFITDRKVVTQTCLGMFQMDLISNTQRLPRGRLCLDFEKGMLWLWATHNNDILVVFTNPGTSEDQLRATAQLGDAFFYW